MSPVRATTARLAVATTLLWGCGQEAREAPADTAASQEQTDATLAGPVTGQLRGRPVTLDEANFDGQLAIYEETGWFASPSLLVFMFLDEGEVPAGRTFSKDPEASRGPSVHVHYRWRDSTEDDLDMDVAASDYHLRLVFGELEDGELPGTIEFAVPGEATRVAGSFRASVDLPADTTRLP